MLTFHPPNGDVTENTVLKETNLLQEKKLTFSTYLLSTRILVNVHQPYTQSEKNTWSPGVVKPLH